MVRRNIFSVGTLVLLLAANGSFAAGYNIDAAHSSVEFKVRHLVSKLTGKFTDFAGKIGYDAQNPTAMTIEATIQAASVNTNNEQRDGHLRNPDFFEVEKYPTIVFKSKSTKVEGESLMVTGDLTMHGVTKEVVLPVKVLGTGTHPRAKKPVAGFEANLTLKRSEYGMNYSTAMVGDEIGITLLVEALGE